MFNLTVITADGIFWSHEEATYHLDTDDQKLLTVEDADGTAFYNWKLTVKFIAAQVGA